MKGYNGTKPNDQRGFIALTTVIVMMIVVLTSALSANRFALGELVNTVSERHSQASFYRGDACLEEALFQLRGNASYTGGTLTFPEGSCLITVVANGSLRAITIKASYNNRYRTLYAEAIVNTQSIVLQNWKEVF